MFVSVLFCYVMFADIRDIEVDEERVMRLNERVGLMIEHGLPVNYPEPIYGDFTKTASDDPNLEPYDQAIANGEVIFWFNNAKEVMTRDQNVQHGLGNFFSWLYQLVDTSSTA